MPTRKSMRTGAIAVLLACVACANAPAAISQPDVEGFQVAPEETRVDLAMPAFTNPTEVTNPLFPVSSQESVLLLGQVDGKEFRTEVTLLPETRIIRWNGVDVEVLVSQYVAFLDGRLHEVAYDFYAQDDSGAVWYFGEDVFNFKDGAIVDTHGTWIAGRDGNAAMIMPADPQVGDVYRPENIPGFVFEEVTVRAVDHQLDGPLGPVAGGLLIEELHMDGNVEDKTFGPGYGEFFTGGGGDVEALALAIPTDTLSGGVPAEISALTSASLQTLEAVKAEDWDGAEGGVAEMIRAWSQVDLDNVSDLIEPLIDSSLAALGEAISSGDGVGAGQAAIDAAMSSFDLQLRYRPPIEIDFSRFDLWLNQLQLDAQAEEASAMNGDFFVLDYIRDRMLASLAVGDATTLNFFLEELLGAVADEDFAGAAEMAAEFRKEFQTFEVVS